MRDDPDRARMNTLYYWRRDNYQRDRRFGFGYHLNQNSPVMERMSAGDTVWAFTRDDRGRYVLAAALIVRAVTRNAPAYRYGRWRVWGDPDASRYFAVDAGPGAEELIRHLGITTRARALAQSFQGASAVRPLTPEDHELLRDFAAGLPVLERIGLYAEDEFEARLVLGESARGRLIPEPEGAAAARMRYLYETVDVTRARANVQLLQKRYAGRCQICRFDPRARYGRNLCHGHHIHWLSRGGDDVIDNMVLICPTHHAAVHQADAVFDFRDLAFRFASGLVEELSLNEHLALAA